jgi:hypothetical protein
MRFHPLAENSREAVYLRERREALGGPLPMRRSTAPPLAKVESEFPDGGGDWGQPPSPPPSPSRPTPGPLAAVSAIDRGPDIAHPAPRMRRSKCSSSTRRRTAKAMWRILRPSRGADAGLARCRGAGTPDADAVATLADAEEKLPSAESRCRRALHRILCEEASSIWPHWTTSCRLAVRPCGDAVAADGAREPHAVRHSSHRRISAGRHHCQALEVACSACGAWRPLPARHSRSRPRGCRLERPERTVRARESFRASDEGEAAEIINELETLRQDTPQRADRRREAVAARSPTPTSMA